MGLKKGILQEIEEQQIKMVWPCHANGRLLNCWTGSRMEPTGGKEGAADQSTHGRMALGKACKGETSRMTNVLIKSSGGRKLCLWVEKNCVPTEMF
jgi:hypothetical protein